MATIDPRFLEHQARRFLRPDGDRYLRPDWERYMRPDWRDRRYWVGEPPEHPFDPPPQASQPARKRTLPPSPEEIEAAERERLAFRHEIAKLRLDLELLKFTLKGHKAFNPNQPRVPAGNPDGGQWTSEESEGRIRLASSDRPRLGPAAMARIAAETAKRLIEAYRSENGLRDLFGRNQGTVAFTTLNGVQIFGSNSTSPLYTSADLAAAKEMRDRLVEKYPIIMDADEVGRRPNNALFHAESNIILRAAMENGGSLEGRDLEVHVDRPLCPSCRRVLPLLGLELGNPRVTFIGPSGRRQTIRDGAWEP